MSYPVAYAFIFYFVMGGFFASGVYRGMRKNPRYTRRVIVWVTVIMVVFIWPYGIYLLLKESGYV
jgi:hypothetical protein